MTDSISPGVMLSAAYLADHMRIANFAHKLDDGRLELCFSEFHGGRIQREPIICDPVGIDASGVPSLEFRGCSLRSTPGYRL
jgi:hypothetical protein